MPNSVVTYNEWTRKLFPFEYIIYWFNRLVIDVCACVHDNCLIRSLLARSTIQHSNCWHYQAILFYWYFQSTMYYILCTCLRVTWFSLAMHNAYSTFSFSHPSIVFTFFSVSSFVDNNQSISNEPKWKRLTIFVQSSYLLTLLNRKWLSCGSFMLFPLFLL